MYVSQQEIRTKMNFVNNHETNNSKFLESLRFQKLKNKKVVTNT